jgi:hypothetical protein
MHPASFFLRIHMPSQVANLRNATRAACIKNLLTVKSLLQLHHHPEKFPV